MINHGLYHAAFGFLGLMMIAGHLVLVVSTFFFLGTYKSLCFSIVFFGARQRAAFVMKPTFPVITVRGIT